MQLTQTVTHIRLSPTATNDAKVAELDAVAGRDPCARERHWHEPQLPTLKTIILQATA